jgi:hypothetical protein
MELAGEWGTKIIIFKTYDSVYKLYYVGLFIILASIYSTTCFGRIFRQFSVDYLDYSNNPSSQLWSIRLQLTLVFTITLRKLVLCMTSCCQHEVDIEINVAICSHISNHSASLWVGK